MTQSGQESNSPVDVKSWRDFFETVVRELKMTASAQPTAVSPTSLKQIRNKASEIRQGIVDLRSELTLSSQLTTETAATFASFDAELRKLIQALTPHEKSWVNFSSESPIEAASDGAALNNPEQIWVEKLTTGLSKLQHWPWTTSNSDRAKKLKDIFLSSKNVLHLPRPGPTTKKKAPGRPRTGKAKASRYRFVLKHAGEGLANGQKLAAILMSIGSNIAEYKRAKQFERSRKKGA